jgi:redox-sensitive bicupin YhaK (pirin superfamily)
MRRARPIIAANLLQPGLTMTAPTASSCILDRIAGRSRDLGGFSVRRVLPIAHRKLVGPFVFFDEMGPAVFTPGGGIDVRPHPHIGLATVTYLFEGRIRHRDSLGSLQDITPGDVNWMTAGRGIVHSERTHPDDLANGYAIHGIQSWVALPAADEEIEPAFVHHPAASLPRVQRDGARLSVIAGRAYGAQSPVAVRSPTLYVAAELDAGAVLPVCGEHEERAVYVVSGAVEIGGEAVPPGELAVLVPGAEVTVISRSASRLMLLGGARLPEARTVWWNLVSTRPERIEQAKADWLRYGEAGSPFPAVPGEHEFIPLPSA